MQLLEHYCFAFTFWASWTCQFNKATKAVLIILTPTQWEATRETEIVTRKKERNRITCHLSSVFSSVPWHHFSCVFVPCLHVAAVLIWVFAWIFFSYSAARAAPHPYVCRVKGVPALLWSAPPPSLFWRYFKVAETSRRSGVCSGWWSKWCCKWLKAALVCQLWGWYKDKAPCSLQPRHPSPLDNWG